MMKLKDDYEIALWYSGKQKNMKESDIELSIMILRAIKELE